MNAKKFVLVSMQRDYFQTKAHQLMLQPGLLNHPLYISFLGRDGSDYDLGNPSGKCKNPLEAIAIKVLSKLSPNQWPNLIKINS